MRKFIEYILRQRLMILLFGALVLVAGLQSYRDLPVDAFPDVSPALVQVFGETEGLAPEEVERYVTYPIEVAMNGLPNLKEIRSVSNFGLSIVNIYFEDGTDIYFARQLVNERLQMAREEIPQGFSEPAMGPITTGLGLVLFFYLEDESGTRSAETMREIQDWIVKFNLQTVPGVTEVLSLGGEIKQFQVHIDPNALLRYGLTIADVTQAIRINNGNVGAQYIVKNSETFLVRSVGLARDATDLENIVLKTRDGVPVYVRDIGAVKIGGAVRQGLATMNGEGEVVAALVLKLIGTNTSKVIANVKERLETINAALPPGVRIVAYYDQSKIVSKSVSTVTGALFQGVILVALVILAFMGGVRPSLVVALSIPFSIATAFILMRVTGMSANLMSLGGLAIAIGMMVDGAIVIVENADRLLRSAKRGASKHQVIARACAEVVRPIGFAILIIIVVFLPIITLQGVEGKTFRPLALTTSLAMLGSLIFAVLIAPVLSEILMRSRQPSVRRGKVKTDNAKRVLHLPLMWYQQTTGRPGEPYKAIADSFLSNLRRWRRPTNGRQKKPKQDLTERILYLPLRWYQKVSGRPGEPYKAIADRIVSKPHQRRRPTNGQRKKPKPNLAEWIVSTLLDFYRPILVQFVEIPRRALMLGGGMLAVGTLIIPFLGSEFVPRLNEGDLLIRLTMAPSISLESAKETALRFEKRLLERFPEVERVVTRVGRGEVGAHADPVNNGEAFVGLRPEDQWPVKRTPDELFAAMSEAFEDFPGVQFNFTQPIAATIDELLTGTKAELAIKLFGPDSDVLLEKANEVEKVVRTIDGAADIQVDQVTGTPQLRIVVDRDAISRFGINIEDVQSVIRAAVGGDTAGQIFEGIKRFDIVVRYIKEARATPEAIRAIVIRTPAGVLVPLEQIAHVEEIVGPRQITRENGQRFITVQANVRGRDIGSFVAEATRSIAERVEFPSGYLLEWGGQFELQQEANARLAVVVPITLAIVFFLLFVNFGSIKSALLIMLNIPLALVGGVVALWLGGLNLSVPASVGFIALFGIALENGMVLVTYFNTLVSEGRTIARASVEGACMRMRPVLLTALTTALGLAPLLYATGTGSEVQKPLATVVIGGLVTSTILTLLVLPAVYRWFVPGQLLAVDSLGKASIKPTPAE